MRTCPNGQLVYGFVPGGVFATIVEGLEAIAMASHDLWRSGSVGEQLAFSRLEPT